MCVMVVRTIPMNPLDQNANGQCRRECRPLHTAFLFSPRPHRYPETPCRCPRRWLQSCPWAALFSRAPAAPRCPCLQKRPHGKYPAPSPLSLRPALRSLRLLFQPLAGGRQLFLMGFVCLIGATLLSILAFLLGMVALGILLFSGQPAEGVKYLIIAFCISPYGIPMFAVWLISKAEAFNNLLKSV